MEHAGRLSNSSTPWRATALVVAAIAAVELVGLLALAGVRLAPDLHRPGTARAAKAAPPTARRHTATHRAKPKPPPLPPARPVSRVSVLVLNGNGVTGAASAEAGRLRADGYRSATATDAARHNYAKTLVMFAAGYEPEGRRLAHALGTRLVSPVDGMTGAQLRGSQLVAILGDS